MSAPARRESLIFCLTFVALFVVSAVVVVVAVVVGITSGQLCTFDIFQHIVDSSSPSSLYTAAARNTFAIV